MFYDDCIQDKSTDLLQLHLDVGSELALAEKILIASSFKVTIDHQIT